MEHCKLEHHTLILKDIDSEQDGSHLAAAIMDVFEGRGFASELV